MPEAGKQPPQEFPTTRWTLIRQALADGTTVRTVALEELVLRYRPPLRAHLILRKRLDEELAEELLQGFITEKILEQYLLRHADHDKGRFRSLLVRSLGNYYLDWIRAQAVQPVAGMDAILDEAPADSEGVSAAFDIAWARQLLDEVLTAMRTDCEVGGQSEIWGVFECRLLVPLYEQSEPLTYEEVCQRFGFASPEQASNALVTAKRKFQRTFERVAARYQHNGEEAEDILRELTGILSRAGPLEWRQAPAAGTGDRQTAKDCVQNLDDSQPARMVRLLKLPPDVDELWLHADLRGIMRHQLSQLLSDLEINVAGGFAKFADVATATPLLTLADLYSHPRPPLELLEAVKRYGRKRVHRPGVTLPDEIASALYFASIAAAIVRHDRRISTSDDELLRYGFERLLERPWIETPLRELFQLGLARLGARDEIV
jgi:hypothetical protein